ncbi:MAG: hypothetical protein Q9M16_06055 [Mariprofundus sp.]|nr:hypothetical protein [Mariprofundus sp.]
MDNVICPVCGCEPFDEPCEHTVYVAANECGLIYIAEQYRSQYETVVEQILKEHGELEEGDSLSDEDFPCDYAGELQDRLKIESIVYETVYGMPPSGLTVYAAFIENIK